MPHKDKEERKKYNKRYWKKWYANSENRKQHVRAAVKRTQKCLQETREWFRAFKASLKCSRCPENHPACLEFHHKDSTKKEIEVTKAVFSNRWSIKRILEEIEKCEVLCCNCHRKLHYNEKTGERG